MFGLVAELADAADSKSAAPKACGFESHRGHPDILQTLARCRTPRQRVLFRGFLRGRGGAVACPCSPVTLLAAPLEHVHSTCSVYPQCRMKLAASIGVIRSSIRWTSRHSAPTVRWAADRMSCLSLANASSIG